MASMVTNIPDEPQGTQMSRVQCQEEILMCKHIRGETFQECSTLEASTHRKEDMLEMSGSKEVADALSGTTPRPTSFSYQEVHRAGGVECDKRDLEKTSGGSLVGVALVDVDSSDGSRCQNSVLKDHHKEMMQDQYLRVIKEASYDDLKAVTLEHYNEFVEDGQRSGGSPRPQPQTLNAEMETRSTRGQMPMEKDSRSNSLSPDTRGHLVPVMGQTEEEVAEMCQINRGIQGHHNSCYLDATLFAMFSCTYVFDDILTRSYEPNEDIKEYNEIQKVLRNDIVCTLRKEKYVPHENVMKLRELLDSLGGVSGLTTEEKDPEEFLNSLIHALRVPPFLKLS